MPLLSSVVPRHSDAMVTRSLPSNDLSKAYTVLRSASGVTSAMMAALAGPHLQKS